MPSASHLRIFFPVSFFGFPFLSSPEDAFAGAFIAFFALLDLGPAFPPSIWLAGVVGLDVSGVDTGVTSVDSPSSCGFLNCPVCETADRPGRGGGNPPVPLSELEGGVRLSIVICGAR